MHPDWIETTTLTNPFMTMTSGLRDIYDRHAEMVETHSTDLWRTVSHTITPYSVITENIEGKEGRSYVSNKIKSETIEQNTTLRHKVICDNRDELSSGKILKTISEMKNILIATCKTAPVKNIVCKLTLETKKDLVLACKKLKMFDKTPPIIAQFDEYGRYVSDKLTFDETLQGVTVVLLDSADYGPYYLSLCADIDRSF